jgi:lysophospholipase L1-like esterase
MKILFQGDSITDAFRRPEEINPAFQLGNGYAFLVAARLGEALPERGYQWINRGVSGEGVRALKSRWEKDALEIGADVFSLLIGVNDTIQAMGGDSTLPDDEFMNVYAWLINSILARKQETKVILMEPFLLEVGAVTPAWRAHLAPRQAGIARFAAQRQFPLLKCQEVFEAACRRAPAGYWAYDGIHPTHAGFALLADCWLRLAAPLLDIPPGSLQK